MIKFKWFFLFISVVSISCLLVGCSSDEDDNGSETVRKLLPVKIGNDVEWMELGYDDTNRLLGINYTIAGDPDENFNVELLYNSSGQISKTIYKYDEGGREVTFRYKDDSVFISEHEEHIYILNEKKLVEKMIIRPKSVFKEVRILTYDASDRLIKSEETGKYGGSDNPQTSVCTVIYEYDNAKGISYNINIPQWLALFMMNDDDVYTFLINKSNNLSKVTSTIVKSGKEDEVYTEQTTYVINEDGYPKELTIQYDDELYRQTIQYKPI